MAVHVIKMPDVGEGVAEAELVEWHVAVGELVREDAILAAVMTDKATVEIPSPVEGKIAWLGAEIGDTVAVGAALVADRGPRRAAGPDLPVERARLPGSERSRRQRPRPAGRPPARRPARRRAPPRGSGPGRPMTGLVAMTRNRAYLGCQGSAKWSGKAA